MTYAQAFFNQNTILPISKIPFKWKAHQTAERLSLFIKWYLFDRLDLIMECLSRLVNKQKTTICYVDAVLQYVIV